MAINNRPKKTKPVSRIQRDKYNGDKIFAQNPRKDHREEHIRRSNDTIKNISVGLQDHDEAILYFFNNTIKPRVEENDKLINVPLKYGDPEMWAATQKNGYILDKKGKIITPAIMYRRTNVAKDDSFPVDKTDRNIVYQYPKKWTQKNNYDRFSLINNIIPTYEMFNVVVPDYVILTYECVIWTSFVSQMNEIIQQLEFWESKYWGDDKHFKFKAKYDSFDQNTEVSTDKGRLVRSNFTIELRGFLIPEFANDMIQTQKTYTKQQIILDTETEVDVVSLAKTDPECQKILVTTNKQPAISGNQTLRDYVDSLVQPFTDRINYLRKQKVYSTLTAASSSIITTGGNSVVTYNSVYTASAPSGIDPVTGEQDFLVFCNGQYMEHDAFVINQSSADFIVTVSTGSLGYSLDATDEVVTWGKFE